MVFQISSYSRVVYDRSLVRPDSLCSLKGTGNRNASLARESAEALESLPGWAGKARKFASEKSAPVPTPPRQPQKLERMLCALVADLVSSLVKRELEVTHRQRGRNDGLGNDSHRPFNSDES